MSIIRRIMYVDKVLLTIALCVTNAWCTDDRTLTRNARTIDLSSLRNFWSGGNQLWEWTKSGAANLASFVSLTSISSAPMRIEFEPEDGLRAAEEYQRRYGYRGERLIEQLGNGFAVRQPMPNVFLMPPRFSINFS